MVVVHCLCNLASQIVFEMQKQLKRMEIQFSNVISKKSVTGWVMLNKINVYMCKQ